MLQCTVNQLCLFDLQSVMNRIHTISVPYAVMKACPMSWVQRVHIHKGLMLFQAQSLKHFYIHCLTGNIMYVLVAMTKALTWEKRRILNLISET